MNPPQVYMCKYDGSFFLSLYIMWKHSVDKKFSHNLKVERYFTW